MNIFRQVNAVDYQGICSPQSSQISAAPNSAMYSILKTIATIGHYMLTWTVNLNLADALEPVYAWAADDDDEGITVDLNVYIYFFFCSVIINYK